MTAGVAYHVPCPPRCLVACCHAVQRTENTRSVSSAQQRAQHGRREETRRQQQHTQPSSDLSRPKLAAVVVKAIPPSLRHSTATLDQPHSVTVHHCNTMATHNDNTTTRDRTQYIRDSNQASSKQCVSHSSHTREGRAGHREDTTSSGLPTTFPTRSSHGGAALQRPYITRPHHIVQCDLQRASRVVAAMQPLVLSCHNGLI